MMRRKQFFKPLPVEQSTKQILEAITKGWAEAGPNCMGYTYMAGEPFHPTGEGWNLVITASKREVESVAKTGSGLKNTNVIAPEVKDGRKTGLWEVWTTWGSKVSEKSRSDPKNEKTPIQHMSTAILPNNGGAFHYT